VRGLGTGVDVGAAAPESSFHGVSSLPARADGSMARVVRGLGAGVSCCAVLVFASFPYKLAVWVLGMSLNIPRVSVFGQFFLKNWSFFFFFMIRQSSCRLLQKFIYLFILMTSNTGRRENIYCVAKKTQHKTS
jgi:hypothetical protein